MEAIPLPRTTNCSALLEVFARFGIPKEVLLDNGSNFIAQLSEEFMTRFITLNFTIPSSNQWDAGEESPHHEEDSR